MDTPEESEDLEKVRATIAQLNDLVDLIGLRTCVIKRTPKGKSSEPDPWAHTRACMQQYADPVNTEALIKLFEDVGCRDELQAVRWLLTYDELVP
jgi:hypothetical protein